MRKKILFLLLVVIIFTAGCGSKTTESHDNVNANDNVEENDDADFKVIKTNYEGKDVWYKMHYVIDRHTKLVYLLVNDSHGLSLTLLHDKDGSLMTEEELKSYGK